MLGAQLRYRGGKELPAPRFGITERISFSMMVSDRRMLNPDTGDDGISIARFRHIAITGAAN